jgi:hypothetical protein
MFQTVYVYIDNLLIFFFRLPEVPIAGYFLGSSVLALICVLLGYITLYAASIFNKRQISMDSREMVRMHNLSIFALLAKNKSKYQACNKEANEAFGKYFFGQIALGMSSLWPVPFALGWMQTRFSDVAFLLPFHIPMAGRSVGYAFTFILVYILVYILFANIKNRIPFLRKMDGIICSHNEHSEAMVSLADIPSKNENLKSKQGSR